MRFKDLPSQVFVQLLQFASLHRFDFEHLIYILYMFSIIIFIILVNFVIGPFGIPSLTCREEEKKGFYILYLFYGRWQSFYKVLMHFI